MVDFKEGDMRNDPNITYDGFKEITGGVNGTVPPYILPVTQFSKAKNVTFRGGVPHTRPGFIRRELNFVNSIGAVDATIQTNFEDYTFQGAAAFESANQLVVAVGGRLFSIELDFFGIGDITTADTNYVSNYRCWFAEAEGFMIIQDGISAPWIYDGALTRRSDTFGINGKREIPVGTAMCYSQGRLIVTLAGDERSFVIGDIVGGPSGTATYHFKDSVLKFTENTLINGGGSFSVPVSAGPIRAVRPVAQVDTSTGQGPTQIFTTSAVFSLNTPSDRTTWASVTYPIQTYSLINNGALSDRSTVLVNGDIWMRALDGVRSFVVARRDFGTWVNAPVSQEVADLLKTDAPDLLMYSSAAVFDNRLMMTVRPYVNFDHGVPFEGLIVVDFSPVSYLAANPRPVWEGAWTGFRFLQVVSGVFNGVERCFIFCLDSANNIELWEMTKDTFNDRDGITEREIDCSIETGSYRFGDDGFDLKKLAKAWLWITDIQGSQDFEVQYKAGTDPCWHTWSSWSFCATMETCGTTRCLTPQNLHPQSRRPFLLPEPTGACDSVVGVPNHVGEEFQVRFQWSGTCSLASFLIAASQEQQDVTALCPQSSSCETVACCPPNDWDYLVN